MLCGAVLGVLLTLPFAAGAAFLGILLDAETQDPADGWMLGVVVLVTGSFVGAIWYGQAALMRGWPHACRERIWREWRRGLAVSLPLALPVAVLIGWLAWRDEGSWSLSLGIGLEACWLFAGVGTMVGYVRGERKVRGLLEQAGYARVGWFQYRLHAAVDWEDSAITARAGGIAQRQAGSNNEVSDGVQPNPG
jgi:hypothetical protein